MKKVIQRLFLSFTVATSLSVVCIAQDNPNKYACPKTAVISINPQGKISGLLPYYSDVYKQVNQVGKTITKDGDEWTYVRIKNERVPGLTSQGNTDVAHPLNASYLLFYNSENDIRSTWWTHEHNNLKNEISTFHINEGYTDLYNNIGKNIKFNLQQRKEIVYELSKKGFVIAEYANTINNKSDFIFTNTLFVKSGVIKDKSDYAIIKNFYNDFKGKFENTVDENWENRLFITTVKGKSSNYLAHFKVENQKLVGELFAVNNITKPTILTGIDKEFSALSNDGIIYVYGDNLFDLGKKITETASKKNILLISRNTAIKKTFSETEKVIANLRNKKLDSKTLSFVNGTPSSIEEAGFQSFETTDIELLKKLKGEVDLKATTKTSKIITTKEELLQEITEGNNDVLFIVAHCDEKNLYFGKEKISLEELNSKPIRGKRGKERVAILFSCLTGKLFDKQKPFLPFFRKNLQSFSEVFIEKNFFDLIISPPTTINGAEVLKMMDILDEHNILELRNYLNKILINGEIYNIVKR